MHPLLDPSFYAIIATSTSVILYASQEPKSELLPTKCTQTKINSNLAIYFPITTSLTLLTLFYFKSNINIIIMASLLSSSFSALSSILESRFSQTNRSIISFLLIATWYFTNGNWILNNILAVSIGIKTIRSFRISSMKVAYILLWLFFLYDIFWVFFSHLFFQKSVMISTGMQMINLQSLLKQRRGWA